MEEQFMFKGKIGKINYSVYFDNGENLGLHCGKPYLEVDIGEGSCNKLENPEAYTIEIPISKIKDYIEMVIIKKLYARK